MRSLRALITLLLLMAAAPLMGQSIIERLVTPGPLSQPHAKLESSCNSCHANFRKEAQNSKCLACHTDVASDIRAGAGYHGRSSNARRSDCKTCHTEHKGRRANIVRLNTRTFNHDLTDFPLRGGHAKVSCASCHTGGKAYRLAPTTCRGCHESDDPHRGRLGPRCQDCHQVSSWKSLKPFDHSKTGFRLTGAHSGASCMSCHKGQQWSGLTTSCYGCHKQDDAHNGTRGTNCSSCHTTSSWREVKFDHDTTGFSLIGAHAQASCTSCHGANNAIKNPPTTCYGCHEKDDSHQGANGTQCADCHVPQGWSRIQFDHDRLTDFPLRGAHRQASCESCHTQPPKVAAPPTTCFGCHEEDDSHKGGNGTDCARCHTETDWEAVEFDHATMTGFPLLGKHAQARCEDCHVEASDQVKLVPQCASCHYEDDVHKAELGPSCGRCHDSNDWTTNISFDHALTSFPLLGKHAALECTDCHADQTFAVKGPQCADCHVDEHHEGRLGTPAKCGDCHTASDWKAWSFDHDTQTGFPLTGKHEGLVCASCHTRAGDPAELSSVCADCHRRDDVHRGEFGNDCQRCHVTDDWSKVTLPEDRSR